MEDSEIILMGESQNSTAGTNDDDNVAWNGITITQSIGLFILAGILEVGGGYLMWKALREKNLPYVWIPVGSIVLILYGIVPTFQPVNSFGRVFAVYGGFFIVLSYLWGYAFDGMVLDAGDYIGSAIALAGVSIAWFWPR